jgi:hypothetical protein
MPCCEPVEVLPDFPLSPLAPVWPAREADATSKVRARPCGMAAFYFL